MKISEINITIEKWHKKNYGINCDFFFPSFFYYLDGWFFKPSYATDSDNENSDYRQNLINKKKNISDFYKISNNILEVENLMNRVLLFDWSACIRENLTNEDWLDLKNVLIITWGMSLHAAGLNNKYKIIEYEDEGYPVIQIKRIID